MFDPTLVMVVVVVGVECWAGEEGTDEKYNVPAAKCHIALTLEGHETDGGGVCGVVVLWCV